jgi:hypothetical protein
MQAQPSGTTSELPKEKAERWTRWRAFAQVRHSSNIQLLPYSLVEAAAIGVVVSVDLILADWRHTAGSCSGELSLL